MRRNGRLSSPPVSVASAATRCHRGLNQRSVPSRRTINAITALWQGGHVRAGLHRGQRWRVDSSVMTRPSPRARDASAIRKPESLRGGDRLSHNENASFAASSRRGYGRPASMTHRMSACWPRVSSTSMPQMREFYRVNNRQGSSFFFRPFAVDVVIEVRNAVSGYGSHTGGHGLALPAMPGGV